MSPIDTIIKFKVIYKHYFNAVNYLKGAKIYSCKHRLECKTNNFSSMIHMLADLIKHPVKCKPQDLYGKIVFSLPFLIKHLQSQGSYGKNI